MTWKVEEAQGKETHKNKPTCKTFSLPVTEGQNTNEQKFFPTDINVILFTLHVKQIEPKCFTRVYAEIEV